MGNTHDAQIARIEADLLGRFQTIEDYRWGYTKDRSPDTWWIHYPSAAGGNQSPVDIPTEDVQFDHDLSVDPLKISYSNPDHEEDGPVGQSVGQGEASDDDNSSTCEGSNPASGGQVLSNNGNIICIDIRQSKCHITGGPLKENIYTLKQVHMHWGDNDNTGSEHLVNGRPYAAEVHLVHWNDTLYETYEEAVRRDDGIAIIAVFVKIVENGENEGLLSLSKLIEDVLYRDQEVRLMEEFDVPSLLPEDTEKYWSYQGSFTVPPCHETVTWILFVQPISITSQTLNKYRQLRTYCENETRPDDEQEGQIQQNTRPVQPLGTRKITTVDTVALRLHSLESSDRYVAESLTSHSMPFPELFDQKRRDELFQWIQ